MQKDSIKFAFFGTSEFSIIVLDELKTRGFVPKLIITAEDKSKGRNLVMTPPEARVWAEKNNIPFVQLKTLRENESEKIIRSYLPDGFDVFVVASYGKIIPVNVLGIPKYKTLNIHPSLLPKLRGSSPIQSAILRESETGVSIIRLDSEIDHGPILSQKKVVEWSTENVPYAEDLEKMLAKEGALLLAETLPNWVLGKVQEVEQDHSLATFTEKIKKADAELNLRDPASTNLMRVRAFHLWPGAYFFQNGKRIIVKKAHIQKNELVLDRVIPEGKREMDYADYLKGMKSIQALHQI